MADRRGVLIPLVILGFILLSPDPTVRGSSQLDRRPRVETVVEEERRQLSALRNSSYGDLLGARDGALLNLTGLELDRGYAWSDFPQVQERASQQLEYSLGEWGKAALRGESAGGSPPALYGNVTGYVAGEWTRSRVQDTVFIPHLNLTAYAPEGPFGALAPQSFGRNITGGQGHVRIRFHEQVLADGEFAGDAPNITKMMVDMTINDRHNSAEHGLEMYGFHFVNLGQTILTTTSAKFAGIFMSPHFSLSQHTFELSRAFMNASLAKTMQFQEDHKIEALNPWSTDSQGMGGSPFSEPECELVVYLQQLAPIGGPVSSPALLSFLERELRYPTGANVPAAPALRFSMLAFSPDCGFVLESKGPPDHVPQEGDHLTGPKLEVLLTSSRHHLLLFSLTLGGQLVLFLRQMQEANTPSTRSRLSFYTIALLALGDGFTTMSCVLFSFLISRLWVNLMTAGFLACISVMFFGMRFLMDIWAVQAPERARQERQGAEELRQRRERSAGNNPTTESDETPAPPPPPPLVRPSPRSLPLSVTASMPIDMGATPILMPSDQAGLEIAPITPADPATNTTAADPSPLSFGSMYTRFYLLLLSTLFLSLNAAFWPPTARRLYFTLLAFFYVSFWCPQIVRNVQRNCRRALSWHFVVGQTLLRIAPFVYFYAYENNVLFAEKDLIGLAVLGCWLWIQVLVLASQEVVGPRWFVKSDWAPEAYDYHPILRADEEGDALPLGLSQPPPTSPSTDRRGSIPGRKAHAPGKRVFDCAICMQELEVPVVEAGGAEEATGTLGANLLARRLYMVTPCRHIFHSACLEGWLRYRLQCPNCREGVPPI